MLHPCGRVSASKFYQSHDLSMDVSHVQIENRLVMGDTISKDVDRLYEVLDLVAGFAMLQIWKSDVHVGTPESSIFRPEEV